MESSRKPTEQEENLISFLINKSSKPIPDNWRTELLVRSMNDGGMGSLCLFPNGKIEADRLMGERISEIQFMDEDHVEVIVSLNVDDQGELFELDVWKTDFSKLIRLPDLSQLS